MSVVKICNAQRAPTCSGVHKYQVPITVHVDSPDDCGGVVTEYLYNNGYPRTSPYQEPNFTDILSLVKNITATRRASSALIWDAVVHYEALTPIEEGEAEDPADGGTDDPLQFRYEIDVQTSPYQVPVWNAWNIDAFPRSDEPATGCEYVRPANTLGPLVNSAGTVLDPPLMRDEYETVYRFTGNWAGHDDAFITPKVGKLNDIALIWSDRLTSYYAMSQLNEFPRHTLKCTAANAKYMRTNGVDYWQYTYEFRVRYRNDSLVPYDPSEVPDGWYESVLDQGVQRWIGPGCPDGKGGTYSAGDFESGMGRATPIISADKKRTPEKRLLDGHGQPDDSTAKGVWFRYRLQEEQSFVTLMAMDIFQPVPP